MEADARFEELLREWRRLAAGDRKAVLRHMPPERRRALHRVLAEDVGESPYRAYSPWLGVLVEVCVGGETADGAIRPRARAALAEAHRQVEEELGGKAENPPLFDLFRATLRNWLAKP